MRSEKTLWIRFDEDDRMQPGPGFCLPSTWEREICLSDTYEQFSLVVFFPHDKHCPGCREVLEGFAEREQAYRDQESRILAIFPELLEKLATDEALQSLGFPVLSDEDGEVRSAYACLVDASLIGPEDSFIYLLDAYGAPYIAVAAPDADRVTPAGELHEDLLSWLQFIGLQCPE
ncbi:MAG: redoxin domain-containing protein [Chloroflexi bacterium]|nr:redoxin domain-containing protein [Chloroflexota bacterium]